ncbi:hypothetical protein ACP3V3_17025 [Vibrio sp. PNB22_3_1]
MEQSLVEVSVVKIDAKRLTLSQLKRLALIEDEWMDALLGGQIRVVGRLTSQVYAQCLKSALGKSLSSVHCEGLLVYVSGSLQVVGWEPEVLECSLEYQALTQEMKSIEKSRFLGCLPQGPERRDRKLSLSDSPAKRRSQEEVQGDIARIRGEILGANAGLLALPYLLV